MAALLPILGAAATQVVKWVAKPIARQFNYLRRFPRFIKDLEAESKKLDDAFDGLERQVRSGRENLQEPVPAVKTWLDESRKIKDEIHEILNEAANVESGCFKVVARFSLSKKAKKATDRTEEHRGHYKFDPIFEPCPPPAQQTVPGGKTYEFESRKKIEEDIMTTLRGGDVNLIGIYGMGGLGKTTMAERIRNRVLTEKVFQEVAMAVVSQQVDESKIQVEIGGQLGLEKLKEETSQGKVQKLHARLSDTKRTLIILDDVWEGLELENLGIPCDSRGCTILITSRHKDDLNAMSVQKIFRMEVLSEDDAWFLFGKKADICVSDTNLNSIAKEIVKECGGLPIALTAIGVALKDKMNDLRIWKDALGQLRKVHQDMAKVYNPLRLSYDFLPSDELKSLFLLCCLFPEDFDIPLEQLTYFCMGLGIFEGIDTLEEARNRMCTLAERLKSRSLLLDSNQEDHVRMHDVVRDVCIFIARQEGRIGGNDCTWISSSQLVRERNGFPNLRLLFLSLAEEKESKFDNAYLDGIRYLSVLCIEKFSLTTLPHPTQSLHTLILESCEELKMISVVGQLVNLEILICRGCYSIEELPSEMKGLKRLKLLELTGCRNLQSIGRGIISSLVGLEELKMRQSFNRWEAEDREERENAGLRELEALTNLRCLEIDIDDPSLAAENMHLSSELEIFNINIYSIAPYFNFDRRKKMSLWWEGKTSLGYWIEMQLLRDIEFLSVLGNGANNVDLTKSPKITRLELNGCESMKNVVRTSMDDDATVFPLIEYLSLAYLPQLQEICDGPISSNSFEYLKEIWLNNLAELTQLWKSSGRYNYVPPLFANLSSIHVIDCPRLRNLGQLSAAGKDCLPQLEKLQIERCEMMEQVFLCNRHEIIKMFPKLKKFELVSLPNLETFYEGIEGIELPLLEIMKILECPKMKSIIIGRNQSCSGEIISSSDIDDSLHLFSQPQKISFGSSLEVLEINQNPFCGHEIPSSLFNGLKWLTINGYEGSMSLFTHSVAGNLVSLIVLRIRKCDEMIKVIEDEEVMSGGQRILLFPKLSRLELNDLPKLVSFCEWKCEVELPSLAGVDIFKCPNMKNFSLGLVVASNLEALTTDLNTYVGVGVGVGVDVSFHSLKELVIRENENAFSHHKISVSLFSGLEKLEFSWCQGSGSLFSSSAVGNLLNLKVLEIKKCDEIVKVIEDREEEEDKKVVSGGERTVMFPKLETLWLEDLPKLVNFCEWKCDVELPSLRIMDIKFCGNMENFSFGSVAAPNSVKIGIHHEYTDVTEDFNGSLRQLLAQEKERIEKWWRRMEKMKEEGGEEEQESEDEIQEHEEEDHQN